MDIKEIPENLLQYFSDADQTRVGVLLDKYSKVERESIYRRAENVLRISQNYTGRKSSLVAITSGYPGVGSSFIAKFESDLFSDRAFVSDRNRYTISLPGYELDKILDGPDEAYRRWSDAGLFISMAVNRYSVSKEWSFAIAGHLSSDAAVDYAASIARDPKKTVLFLSVFAPLPIAMKNCQNREDYHISEDDIRWQRLIFPIQQIKIIALAKETNSRYILHANLDGVGWDPGVFYLTENKLKIGISSVMTRRILNEIKLIADEYLSSDIQDPRLAKPEIKETYQAIQTLLSDLPNVKKENLQELVNTVFVSAPIEFGVKLKRSASSLTL